MNRSIVQRTAVIAAAIALPWAGCAWWSARREAAAKEALAAEIRAEIAARPVPPPKGEGLPDLTAEYDAILAGFLKADPEGERELEKALRIEGPWSRVPPEVLAAVGPHYGAFALLDARVDRGGVGSIRLAKDTDRKSVV